VPATPEPPEPATPDSVPPNASDPPGPPESEQPQTPRLRHCCLGLSSLCLDRLGLTQAIGGLALGLIALFSSYDHITFAGHTIHLQQQWGVVFIAASVATVFVDAELATRSRLRAAEDAARAKDDSLRAAQDSARVADETAQERDRADRERYLAGEERQRADRERNRAAEARQRQAESFERLDQAALLSGRVQLDPTPTNRDRFQLFLTLLAQVSLEDPDA
jgi:hypothetical protein